MTTVSALLWVSQGEYGQRIRRCTIQYTVEGLGAKEPYTIVAITDARSGESYPIESTLRLQDKEIDVSVMVLAKPEMRSAARGLEKDAKRGPKPLKKAAPPLTEGPMRKALQSKIEHLIAHDTTPSFLDFLPDEETSPPWDEELPG